MFVLERKEGESISLFVEGLEIKIHLIDSKEHKTRVGIDAPEEALILRSELLEAPPPEFIQLNT